MKIGNTILLPPSDDLVSRYDGRMPHTFMSIHVPLDDTPGWAGLQG